VIARLVSAFAQVETRHGSRLRDGALFMYMGSIVKGLDPRILALQPQVAAYMYMYIYLFVHLYVYIYVCIYIYGYVYSRPPAPGCCIHISVHV